MSKADWKQPARHLLSPVVEILVRAGVGPMAVTLCGLLLHLVSGVWIGQGRLRVGGIVLLVAALCDALDGAVARRTGRVTRFGAFLDSCIDRIDETAILAGIAAYFVASRDMVGAAGSGMLWGNLPNELWAVLAVTALGGSLITSYTRARAEGLGLECKVGVFERPERIVVTVLGLLLGRSALAVALVVLALLSWVTVVQRIRHVQGLLEGSVGSK